MDEYGENEYDISERKNTNSLTKRKGKKTIVENMRRVRPEKPWKRIAKDDRKNKKFDT